MHDLYYTKRDLVYALLFLIFFYVYVKFIRLPNVCNIDIIL